MKRCCHITSIHNRFDVRIFHKQCRTLSRAGYAVFLIAPGKEKEIVDGIRIFGFPGPKNRFQRIVQMLRIYRLALARKADLYHFHDCELLVVGLLLKLFSGRKIIYDVHEDFSKTILSRQWLPNAISKILSSLMDRIEKSSSKKFDYIITATPHIAKEFRQSNVIDIRNYPIAKAFPPHPLDECGQSGHSLVYAGGLERVRGIKEIITALGYMHSKYRVKLNLIGSFSERRFKEEVSGLPEIGNVEYLGQLSREETYIRISQSDIGLVCLYPLERFLTSLPVKMFEYMAAGIPVIASEFVLWKEIIEGNNCGVCVNGNRPEEIAKAVEYLFEHPDEARKMGKNGREAVSRYYNWESESGKLLAVYERL